MKNLSASAINTYRICPRKYLYHYIQRIPEKLNIHLIGGKAVHQAIQEKIRSPPVSMGELFNTAWVNAKGDLEKLNLSKPIETRYFHKYLNMAENWERMQLPGHTIQSEVYLTSKKYSLVGVLDEILSCDGYTGLVENKTSSSDVITEDIKLQLGIYALLFQEHYGKWPDFLMVRFLSNGTYKLITIDHDLIHNAVTVSRDFRHKTLSKDIGKYPRSIGRYCQWKNGECSYFDICKPFKTSSN